MSVPTLGYYKVRAFAQPSRLLLKYTGTSFTDKYYEFGSTPETLRDHWYKEKFTLGLDFPNVPYYIDANVKLTQSIAILRYLGRKHGLVARDETGLVRQDLVEQQLFDYRTGFLQTVFNKEGFEENKKKFIAETLPQWLDQLSKFLGSDQWLTGKTLTYVDFLGYEVLDWFRLFSPETIKKYHNLVQYLDRFENLPQIKAYMKSNEFISYFKVRAFAQTSRLILKYTGTPYTDKYYEFGKDLATFKDSWYKEKFTLGLDFPNVPYYIDANVKLTQSIAILRYLGRKHGLVARDETGLVRQDLIEQQFLDYRTGLTEIVHNKDNFESTKAKYIAETLPQQLDQLSKFLGSHQWFVRQTLTYVDFLAYETLDWIRVLSAETLKKYHNLWSIGHTIDAQIAYYPNVTSDHYDCGLARDSHAMNDRCFRWHSSSGDPILSHIFMGRPAEVGEMPWICYIRIARVKEVKVINNGLTIILKQLSHRDHYTITCPGDSGSPLAQYVNGRAVMIGVLSHGTNICAPYDYP
ncbi:unnamed protein product, partial [Oppiella nova]